MKINEQFLSDFMQRVDLNLFTPSLYDYLLDFLEIEKIRRHNGRYVINTFIPPFPGPAFDRFLLSYFGHNGSPPIQSVDLAVTNACVYNCRHCYNAKRRIEDLPTKTLQKAVRQLQDCGAIVVNFTGGEPCLRRDLVEICSSLNDDSCGILATTGYGFDENLAEALSETRVYSVAVSLDSADRAEHDRRRNAAGAHDIALRAIDTAKKYGFYTYTCAVPTKRLLIPEDFEALYELNRRLGVDEVQLIEPAPAGKLLAANLDFGEQEFRTVWQYMAEYNNRPDGPAVSSFAHMESPEFFGCGAGHSHIYVDGTGEVSPCNMLPISYGNIVSEDLFEIIARMQSAIPKPCRTCLAYVLRDFFRNHAGHQKPAAWMDIPSLPLPEEPLPRFFQIIADRDREISGVTEITQGYDAASDTYDDYWLSVASGPIDELFSILPQETGRLGVDCGCGTGYTTARLASRMGPQGRVIAIDLTPAMIDKAGARLRVEQIDNVEFRVANVLNELEALPAQSADIVLATWLIGYLGCEELFTRAARVLKPGGIIGFVAHLNRSPLLPIEVFEEITRAEPGCLLKAARMKFPTDRIDVEGHLNRAGFSAFDVREGSFVFTARNGRDVYDHVMNSGAGTTFYYSLRPEYRALLVDKFIDRIDRRFAGDSRIPVEHRYVIGTARASSE